MKFFNIAFGTTNLFHNKCEYRSRCVGYKDNSYTCTKTLDKNYCGIYNQFLQETWVIKHKTIMNSDLGYSVKFLFFVLLWFKL